MQVLLICAKRFALLMFGMFGVSVSVSSTIGILCLLLSCWAFRLKYYWHLGFSCFLLFWGVHMGPLGLGFYRCFRLAACPKITQYGE